jgi:hypothetical protein
MLPEDSEIKDHLRDDGRPPRPQPAESFDGGDAVYQVERFARPAERNDVARRIGVGRAVARVAA